MKFSVTVTLKKDVLDPQGKVVQNSLLNLGMNLENISSVLISFGLIFGSMGVLKEMKEEEDAGIEFTNEVDMFEDTNIVIKMNNDDVKKNNKNITEAEVVDWDDI